MVKANELRIGNLVNAGAGAYENEMVVGITPREIITINGLHWDIDDDLIDPIPLTPEILEKCGFEKNYEAQAGIDEFVYDKESINLILTQENEKWFYWNHSGLMIDPQYKYLHEIQNLIYILTGTELEINLTEKA